MVYNKKHIAQKEKNNPFPNRLKIDNILNENREVIAKSFNKYFVNIGPDLASNIKEPYMKFLNKPISSRFSFEHVDENTVTKIIDHLSLSTKKSYGIDELSIRLIKSIKSIILSSLTITINQSLVTGICPVKLKIAKVTPIF